MDCRSFAGRALAVAAGLALAACTSLLPRSDSTVRTGWNSFDEAKAAIERIEPHRTTRADLHAAGLDPRVNPNVELLNYSDILRRFPVGGSVAHLDAGLRECLEAGKSCTGYSIALNQQHRERTGPFLLDLLSFKRVTHSTGWTFSALVLMVGDDVVYALYGGKPSISETELLVEPLGPLQNWDGSGLIR
ncbi:MAG TPA: hypothetical protein VLS49_14470 [Usitatibacter sp.]|nr:hypothetical protein [Usitatibacter sp.]